MYFKLSCIPHQESCSLALVRNVRMSCEWVTFPLKREYGTSWESDRERQAHLSDGLQVPVIDLLYSDPAEHEPHLRKARGAAGLEDDAHVLSNHMTIDAAVADCRSDAPYVLEGQAGEANAHHQSEWHGKRQAKNLVAHILRLCEGLRRHLPHAVQGVGTFGLGEHVVELHLQEQKNPYIKQGGNKITFTILPASGSK